MTVEIEARRCCATPLEIRKVEKNGPAAAEWLKDQVRAVYGSVAREGVSADSFEAGCCVSPEYDVLDGYEPEADLGLGCGIPTEYAALRPGETVLDLGSGGGIDAFIASAAVGGSGRVIGLDFTAEMIERARENARKLQYTNVEFVEGDIEAMPLESDSVDVVLSNCVLNLVPDKHRATAEIARVLRAGGRFCISDIVVDGELPGQLRSSVAAHTACVGGALPLEAYLEAFTSAGLVDVEVRRASRFEIDPSWLEGKVTADEVERFMRTGGISSVTVTGRKI